MFEGLLLPWQQIYHFAFYSILKQLLKFLANFTLLKHVKSPRSYGFLITKKADFWLPNFGFKSSLLSLLKVQCLKVFCCHGNKPTILLFNSIFRTTPEVFSKLYFVKSQRSYGFLITKELIFGFQILNYFF